MPKPQTKPSDPPPLVFTPPAVIALHQMGEAFYAFARRAGYSPMIAQQLLEAAAGVAMDRAFKVHAGFEEPSPEAFGVASAVNDIIDRVNREAAEQHKRGDGA